MFTRKAVSAAAAAIVLHAAAATAAPALQPPFNTNYQFSTVDAAAGNDPVPDVPPAYSAMAFSASDFNTLLMSGDSFNSDGTGDSGVWSIGVTRDANHHINGFQGTAVKIAAAPGLPGSNRGIGEGLGFGPGNLLFYTATDNSLGQIKAGGAVPAKQIDLSALTPVSIAGSVAALAFVPEGFQGTGRFKLVSFNGEFYDVALAADGNNTFNIANVTDIGKLADSGPDSPTDTNGPTGLGYVAAGNPQFAQESLLVSTCDFDTAAASNLTAYQIDGNGNPLIATARTMATGLCATGAVVDPLTGDLLFTSFYGYPALTVLTGFTVPSTQIAFGAAAYTVAETAAGAQISVTRGGASGVAASVQYATKPGTASNRNYTDVSGTLHWAAGDAAPKTFTVPIKDDGVYNGPLTVELALSAATGAALGTPSTAEISITNTDPKPVVSLTSVSRSVAESVGTVQLTASLDKISGLPVTVPFSFSGTATQGQDYSFDRNAAHQPVTSIVIPAGSQSGTLDINIINDTLDENDETVVATMGTPVNATMGAVTSNTLTILDDDPPPTVAFAAASGTVTEGSQGAGMAIKTVVVSLLQASGKDVSVPVTLVSGINIDIDFGKILPILGKLLPEITISIGGNNADSRIKIVSPVVIPAGQTSAFAVSVADDHVHEGNKKFDFSLGKPTNAMLGSQQKFTLTVNDND